MQRFVNLLSVATADGRLSEREVKFLSRRAREWGLSDHQFAIAVNRSLEHPGELRIPRRREERAELLRDMLRIMASDGSLLDVEKQLFATVAAHMKFSGAEIEAIIDELVGNEARGEAPDGQPPIVKANAPAAPKPASERQPRKSKAASPQRPAKAQPKREPKPKPKKTSGNPPTPKSGPRKTVSKKAPRR